jgi:predicted nucleic acid-binding protein
VGFLVTAISAFELVAGRSYARDPRVYALLRVPRLGLTRTAGLRADAVFQALRSEGHGIEVRDAMQAGVCLDARRALVTQNVGHCETSAGSGSCTRTTGRAISSPAA